MGFRGSFEHAFDEKGRVSVPARFRDEIRVNGSEGVVITRSITSPALDVYPLAAWIALEEKIKNLPHFDPNHEKFRRYYFGAAVDSSLDKQGRISVPAKLRAHASIDRDVRFVSDLDRFQLWDPATWESVDEDDGRTLRENLDFLAALGI